MCNTVIGYSESTRVQTVDEGIATQLEVMVVKPQTGVGQTFSVQFQIENEENTGSLVIILYYPTQRFCLQLTFKLVQLLEQYFSEGPLTQFSSHSGQTLTELGRKKQKYLSCHSRSYQ